MKRLRPDERYIVLRACLNMVSTHFANSYFHFDALGEERVDTFSSMWYCLTLVVCDKMKVGPVSPEQYEPDSRRDSSDFGEAATFADTRYAPLPTIRVVMASEAELCAIADGHLRP